MPTYQYSCTECGHFFEQFQSFSEDSLTVCPQCEGRLRKVFNAVGVVFKGSGFYRTDSRTPAGASGDSGSGAPSAGSDGATSTKPAAGGDGSKGGDANKGGGGSGAGTSASSGSSTSAA